MAQFFGIGTFGSYTGDFNYTYTGTDGTTGNLEVTLTNTSQNQVFLTAFAFNNPSANITSVTLTSTYPFSLLGGSNFNNGVNAQPFGYFDIGAGLGGVFQGGGSPNDGINLGETGVFTFNLIGTDLDMLTTGSFLSELSMPKGNGNANNAVFFIARFRGPAGSNKAPGSPVPEPTTLLLLGAGFLSMAGFARLRRRRK